MTADLTGAHPHVDELVRGIANAHAQSMAALAADVHPYSAAAIRDWEEIHHVNLSALAARARDAAEAKDKLAISEMLDMTATASAWEVAAKNAETERDRLASRVEELAEALAAIPDFGSPKIRHWLGSQDVSDVPAHIAQIAAIVHGAMRARAVLAASTGPEGTPE